MNRQHVFSWNWRGSSSGIVTAYGLNGPGIESRWGWDFPHPSWQNLGGPHSLLYNEHQVSSPRIKRLGRGVDHPPPYNATVKERVEVDLYSASGPSWTLISVVVRDGFFWHRRARDRIFFSHSKHPCETDGVETRAFSLVILLHAHALNLVYS